jgi:hypothetical protein
MVDLEVIGSQLKTDRFPFQSEGDITLAVRNANYTLGPVMLHIAMNLRHCQCAPKPKQAQKKKQTQSANHYSGGCTANSMLEIPCRRTQRDSSLDCPTISRQCLHPA